jgi:hypothetical protein
MPSVSHNVSFRTGEALFPDKGRGGKDSCRDESGGESRGRRIGSFQLDTHPSRAVRRTVSLRVDRFFPGNETFVTPKRSSL